MPPLAATAGCRLRVPHDGSRSSSRAPGPCTTTSLTEHGCEPNSGYVGSADYLRRRSQIPLDAVPPVVDLDAGLVHLDQLTPLRGALRGWAEARSFDPDATGDIVVAVTEVATNGLVHGAPPVRSWHRGDTLIVQVADSGGQRIPRRPVSTGPAARAGSAVGVSGWPGSSPTW